MRIIRKQLKLPKNDYYIKHLQIVNVFLPVQLTPREIEILAAFMSLEGDIAEDRFGTSARKIVMQGLNLSQGGLGNYMKSLQTKGFITKQGPRMNILPILHPQPESQGYQFKLERNEVN